MGEGQQLAVAGADTQGRWAGEGTCDRERCQETEGDNVEPWPTLTNILNFFEAPMMSALLSLPTPSWKSVSFSATKRFLHIIVRAHRRQEQTLARPKNTDMKNVHALNIKFIYPVWKCVRHL